MVKKKEVIFSRFNIKFKKTKYIIAFLKYFHNIIPQETANGG